MAVPLGSAITGRGRYLRPTAVSGRPRAGYDLGIQVTGLRDAALIPEQLRTTYLVMMQRLEQALLAAAKEVVPGGPTGRLGNQVVASRVGGGSGGAGQRIVIGTVGSNFAAALNRGFTSVPKHGARALRFEDDGEVVYTKRVRVKGRHFYEKWLAQSPPIVEAIYASSFYDIRDLQ